MKTLSNAPFRHAQRGAILAVSLVFLIILTLVGVGAMQNTLLEEKMAGNVKDRNLAFQNAESAVREAELFIEGVVSLGMFNGSGGLFGLTDAEPDYGASATWSATSSHVQSSSDFGAYASPRYFIKQHTIVSGTEAALNLSGYGDNKGSGDITIFNITARGTGGGQDTAEVILRTYYGRAF